MVGLLNQQLADAFDLYSQTKQAHRNVRGIEFMQRHLLSDEIVEGLVEPIDLQAYDTERTLAEVKRLHALANRPNLLINIPGTPKGLLAIEEAIFTGIPVNVTRLFSAEQYTAAVEAYLFLPIDENPAKRRRRVFREIPKHAAGDNRSQRQIYPSTIEIGAAHK